MSQIDLDTETPPAALVIRHEEPASKPPASQWITRTPSQAPATFKSRELVQLAVATVRMGDEAKGIVERNLENADMQPVRSRAQAIAANADRYQESGDEADLARLAATVADFKKFTDTARSSAGAGKMIAEVNRLAPPLKEFTDKLNAAGLSGQRTL